MHNLKSSDTSHYLILPREWLEIQFVCWVPLMTNILTLSIDVGLPDSQRFVCRTETSLDPGPLYFEQLVQLQF